MEVTQDDSMINRVSEEESVNCEHNDDVLEPPSKKVALESSMGNSISSESLAEHAQSLIDEMEVKRKNDENILLEFRKSMELQTENWLELLQSSLSKLYKKNNDTCQDKIQELYTILGRISHLEQEMLAFKQSLKLLYNEVESS